MLRSQINYGLSSEVIIGGYDKDILIRDVSLINSPILVWCYNKDENCYQLHKINVFKNKGAQRMVKVTFEDNTYLKCTPNYPLILEDSTTIIAKNCKNKEIASFEKDQQDYINHYPKKKKVKDVTLLNLWEETYSLQTSDDIRNCALILPSEYKNRRGIIVNI